MLAVGCPSGSPLVETSTGAQSPQSTSGTTSPASSTATTDSTSTTDGTTSLEATTSSSSAEAGDTYGPGFITDPDGGPSWIECSTIEQDCPRGEKCNAWANDGGSAWIASKCFPIAPDPDSVDEPCTVEGNGVSGIDSCDLGSICWDVDGRTLEGTCTPYCTGSSNAPVCDDPARYCQISARGVLAICIAPCDPLDQQTCPEGSACYPINDRFVCAPDASGPDAGSAFDGCDFTNACDPGHFCVNPALSSMCPQGFAGCCLPVCDTSAPECPAALECEPWLPRSAAPWQENVGVCGQDAG